MTSSPVRTFTREEMFDNVDAAPVNAGTPFRTVKEL
jgi:hypothetical protein